MSNVQQVWFDLLTYPSAFFQSNPVERAHKDLKNKMKTCAEKDPDWVNLIPFFKVRRHYTYHAVHSLIIN